MEKKRRAGEDHAVDNPLPALIKNLEDQLSTIKKDWIECGDWLNKHPELCKGLTVGTPKLAVIVLDLQERKIIEISGELIRVQEALRGIVEIGKRDQSNPKYDGYWNHARKVLIPKGMRGFDPLE